MKQSKTQQKSKQTLKKQNIQQRNIPYGVQICRQSINKIISASYSEYIHNQTARKFIQKQRNPHSLRFAKHYQDQLIFSYFQPNSNIKLVPQTEQILIRQGKQKNSFTLNAKSVQHRTQLLAKDKTRFSKPLIQKFFDNNRILDKQQQQDKVNYRIKNSQNSKTVNLSKFHNPIKLDQIQLTNKDAIIDKIVFSQTFDEPQMLRKKRKMNLTMFQSDEMKQIKGESQESSNTGLSTPKSVRQNSNLISLQAKQLNDIKMHKRSSRISEDQLTSNYINFLRQRKIKYEKIMKIIHFDQKSLIIEAQNDLKAQNKNPVVQQNNLTTDWQGNIIQFTQKINQFKNVSANSSKKQPTPQNKTLGNSKKYQENKQSAFKHVVTVKIKQNNDFLKNKNLISIKNIPSKLKSLKKIDNPRKQAKINVIAPIQHSIQNSVLQTSIKNIHLLNISNRQSSKNLDTNENSYLVKKIR